MRGNRTRAEGALFLIAVSTGEALYECGFEFVGALSDGEDLRVDTVVDVGFLYRLEQIRR